MPGFTFVCQETRRGNGSCGVIAARQDKFKPGHRLSGQRSRLRTGSNVRKDQWSIKCASGSVGKFQEFNSLQRFSEFKGKLSLSSEKIRDGLD